MNFLTSLLDFFLPRFCSSCKNKLLTKEEIVCTSCLSNITRAQDTRLKFEFDRKFSSDKIITGFTSLFIFEKDKELQQVIHGLKYDGKYRIGIFLGKLMAQEFCQKLYDWKIDFIIPVPLHHLKRAERGYNQSEFIAKGVQSVLRIPIKTNAIKRNRFTETQTSLNLAERKENLKDAFIIMRKNNLSGKRILLLDDVITTGATCSESGRLLKENGAAEIYALSVAIAD